MPAAPRYASRPIGRSPASARKNQLPPHATSPLTAPYVPDLDAHLRAMAEGRDIFDRDLAVRVERAAHRPDRRVEAMHAGRDSFQIVKRGDDADRAVPAHADVADVVEVDHAARWRLHRRHSTAPTITSEPRGSLTRARRHASCCARKRFFTLRHVARTQVFGPAADHNAGRLAAGVVVHDARRRDRVRRHVTGPTPTCGDVRARPCRRETRVPSRTRPS